eukprot:TRINITY_DN51_c0_g1_i1.p1 TRINITY_DN51_c0_g1~~TRINITY_DN51_c0_g1_i1.p1  ORF type:complete len:163 (-),score=43.20 TRINITY_DN51_c0_g1_i1:82-570(-)
MFVSLLSILLETSALAAFLGVMGVVTSIGLTVMGASYGTAKSGVGVAAIGVMHPQIVLKSVVPVIMAGMIGIYGLIISIFIGTQLNSDGFSDFRGFASLGAGLSVGLSGLPAGMAIGIVGDAGVRANAQQQKLFTVLILILVFAEALGLYGLIIALILAVKN